MIVTASSMVSLLQSTTLLYTSRGRWWCVLEEKRLVPLHSRQAGRVLLLEHARVIPPSCTIQFTKVFFFYSIVDDGQKVMLIRFVTAVSGSLLFSMIL
jgi:hypothetical protein